MEPITAFFFWMMIVGIIATILGFLIIKADQRYNFSVFFMKEGFGDVLGCVGVVLAFLGLILGINTLVGWSW